MTKNILLLYGFSFFKNLMFFGAVAVPFYLHRIGIGYASMFLLEGIFSLSMIVFEIPTGVIADRFGRKWSLFFGSCFLGAAFLIFGFYTSFIVLAIAEILCAFGMTMQSGADRAILYETLIASGSDSRTAAVMARYDAFATTGMFLAFPAGSVFVGSNAVSYNSALGLVFIATAMAVFFAGFLVVFVKETAYEKSKKNVMRQGLDGFLRILHLPKLRKFSLNYALLSSLTFFMFWFYQPLLMENGFSVAWLGVVASAFNFTAMVLLWLTPVIERGLGIKNTLFFSSIIPGFFYLSLFFISGPVMALAAIFFVTNLKLFRAPLLSTLMNREIDSSERATVLSGVSMIERMATTLLYPLNGILTDISLKMTFLIIGIITVGLSLLLRVEETHLTEK
ncbi:MAG: MFS transporter [Thermodesulfobacteriota bacterium]